MVRTEPHPEIAGSCSFAAANRSSSGDFSSWVLTHVRNVVDPTERRDIFGREPMARERFLSKAIQVFSQGSTDETSTGRARGRNSVAPDDAELVQRARDGDAFRTITKEATMPRAVSNSITRRSAVAGLALTAAPLALTGADNAYAQAKQNGPEKAPGKSLYERLGGVFAIAAVVDHFSDAVVKNPIVGQKSKNPQLREWHTKNLKRLAGLKFMRTLWVCNVSGGPFEFTATKPGKTALGLEEAHRNLQISPAEFDEVAAELGRTLDFAKVPKREKAEVLAAFAAHKNEVTAGYVARTKRG
jgi:hemoglobin